MAIQITQEIETTLGVNIPGAYCRLDIRFGLNGCIDVQPLWYTDKDSYTSGNDTINSLLKNIYTSSIRFNGVEAWDMSLTGAHTLFKNAINTNNSIESTIIDID